MPKYYLLDENKNLVEVLNIENNLFRTRLEKLHSELNNTDHSIEFVTQAQYNQLVEDEEVVPNTYYFITDDDTEEALEQSINGLDERLTQQENSMNGLLEGEIHVQYAYVAETTRNELYLHDIYIDRHSNLTYYYRISFRLLTNKNHKTIANTIEAIKNVINDVYGNSKVPASGSYVHTETIAGQAYEKKSVVNSVAYFSNGETLRALCHILGEINYQEAESVSLETANTIEVKTIRLI